MAFLTKLVMIRMSCVRSILEIISAFRFEMNVFFIENIHSQFDHVHHVQGFCFCWAGIEAKFENADATELIVDLLNQSFGVIVDFLF